MLNVDKHDPRFATRMNSKYIFIVATMAVMLIGATALATDTAFATKKREYNQALSQANACGNGVFSINIGCQNTASQIQGDDNSAAFTSQQTFPEADD